MNGKIKMIIFTFLVMFFSMIFDQSIVLAAPNSFDMDGSDTRFLNGGRYLFGREIGLYYKVNTDGLNVYCTQIHKDPVTSGVVKFNLVKELDSRYAYVMMNGYPNKSITGDKEEDYYITAFTVWYLSEPNDYVFDDFNFKIGMFAGATNRVALEVGKLLKGAADYSYVNPKISMNLSNTTLSLSDDKKYYVSDVISVSVVGNITKYNVNLSNAPEGTIITNEKGESKSEFSVNDKFIIKVPVDSIKTVDGKFNVGVSANATINKAFLYSSGISNYQDVAALYNDNVNVSTQLTLEYGITTKVEISKIDASNSQELPGAKLVVKDDGGNIKDLWISEDKPHIINNLKPGKYILTEEIAPEGYLINKDSIEFIIDNTGAVYINDQKCDDNLIVMLNNYQPEPELVPTGSLYLIIAVFLGFVSLGMSIFIIMKKDNFNN